MKPEPWPGGDDILWEGGADRQDISESRLQENSAIEPQQPLVKPHRDGAGAAAAQGNTFQRGSWETVTE